MIISFKDGLPYLLAAYDNHYQVVRTPNATESMIFDLILRATGQYTANELKLAIGLCHSFSILAWISPERYEKLRKQTEKDRRDEANSVCKQWTPKIGVPNLEPGWTEEEQAEFEEAFEEEFSKGEFLPCHMCGDRYVPFESANLNALALCLTCIEDLAGVATMVLDRNRRKDGGE